MRLRRELVLATAVFFLVYILSVDAVQGTFNPFIPIPLVKIPPCEKSSCYPATGNLLIGRESRLSASSTCGIDEPERYCIESHLDTDSKKCFMCDSSPSTVNNPILNHKISNIVHRTFPNKSQEVHPWWQSKNGVENVTIQLDFESEFDFADIVIVFKTFWPAAMLIERSSDFGNSWFVERYFADDCDETFPNVHKGNPRNLTEVVCQSEYSLMAPLNDGKFVYNALSSHNSFANAYDPDLRNLLKTTNLRLNFTKFHKLDNDLLDNHAEIQDKYYYAISEMTMQGSCFCNGHAYRCLPFSGVESDAEMVYGRCDCIHNTKGLNCDFCEDLYNDAPWLPAFGQMANVCQRCTCNNHASSCHFDFAMYEVTDHINGGVCDNCAHNTLGRSCEQCEVFYYQDPELGLDHPEVCKPCDCDPRGSSEEGFCDQITDATYGQNAGRCHCKTNVNGHRCDSCKIGFWNLDETNPDGCQACVCNPLGTVANQGCNEHTGECACKKNVIGQDCNQCLPSYWGLTKNGEDCQPCDCNVEGSLDNYCDEITGQCRCKPDMRGRRCEQPI